MRSRAEQRQPPIKKAFCEAQTFLEYTLVIGVIVTILMAMSPMIRRATQGMIKVTSDLVGCQENSEQLGGEFGHLINSYYITRAEMPVRTQQRLGVTNYIFEDVTVVTNSSVSMNSGFTESPD